MYSRNSARDPPSPFSKCRIQAPPPTWEVASDLTKLYLYWFIYMFN
jgi:hypothetical protein